MRILGLSCLAVLVAGAVHPGEVEVRLAGAGLDIRATGAPLSDVLERISRQTGMKVVYEGAPARGAVTATVERATAAEAVMSLLEGQGVSYALVMDPTGSRVETLMLVTTAAGGALAARPEARRAATPRAQPEPPPEEPQPEVEEEAAAEEPQPPQVPGAPPRGGPESARPPTLAPGTAPTPYPSSPFNPQPPLPFPGASGVGVFEPMIPQPGLPLPQAAPGQAVAPGQAPGQPGTPVPTPPPNDR